MSKPALFGLCFAWLVTITFIVNSITVYDPLSGLSVNNPVSLFSDSSDLTLFEQSIALLRVYWNALTFNIEGLPIIFNLFFQVPSAIIGYMLTGFIRGGGA